MLAATAGTRTLCGKHGGALGRGTASTEAREAAGGVFYVLTSLHFGQSFQNTLFRRAGDACAILGCIAPRKCAAISHSLTPQGAGVVVSIGCCTIAAVPLQLCVPDWSVAYGFRQ